MRTDLEIRAERATDIAAIRAVNMSAFETSTEADLVDALRERAEPIVSLVADAAGSIVGHILFSPVTLSGHGDLRIMGLAPMAVLPAEQRRGFGSALEIFRCNRGSKFVRRSSIGSIRNRRSR